MSGWSNFIADLDNDGWKDLFVARANVLDNARELSNRSYPEPNAILRNMGNVKFEDASATAGPDFQVASAHRGAAFGDVDNDGRLDVVVTVLNGPAKLFRNVSANGNHWLSLHLVGKKSNRMGIGAQIRVAGDDGLVQYNEVTTSTGFGCSSDPRAHFGLGAATTAREIEIRWPSGILQVLKDVKANQVLKVDEPDR